MSASPIARQACSHAQAIPSRKVLVTDPNQMPDVYSSTPGGTLYSTTPGGTRIIYERAFLMNLKNSPLARTPPTNLSNIPLDVCKGSPTKKTIPARSPPKRHNVAVAPQRATNNGSAAAASAAAAAKEQHSSAAADQEQFDMDI